MSECVCMCVCVCACVKSAFPAGAGPECMHTCVYMHQYILIIYVFLCLSVACACIHTYICMHMSPILRSQAMESAVMCVCTLECVA